MNNVVIRIKNLLKLLDSILGVARYVQDPRLDEQLVLAKCQLELIILELRDYNNGRKKTRRD